MLFNVVTIRINTQTKVFEEIESNGVMLLGDLESKLINEGNDFQDFEECCDLLTGDSCILEATIYDSKLENRINVIGLRKTCVTRIN